ncbi:MAG: TerB family tellurite resistance protein [Pseudanabaena sp. SU_2_4]|nr:TerB family tellurite resistance protein [Pseudanabaena sp. SU_2_4]
MRLRQSRSEVSKITDKDLTLKDLSPPVIFLASLVTVLLGVIYADLQVKDEEKLRLNEILDRFIPRESDVRQLTHLMIKGVKQREIYTDSAQWQVLISPLSDVERLLLIGLGYEMSAADGHIEIHEQEYLEQVANFLNIESRYLHVFAMSFGDRGNIDLTALNEVRYLLDPARFHQLEPVFCERGKSIVKGSPITTRYLFDLTRGFTISV